MKLYSKEFDDVYFSVTDGLEEARYVFLEGNNLPDAWLGRSEFVICETGFGAGLNFLAVLKLWQESDIGLRPTNLHFISFEKYPLEGEIIDKSLSNWGELNNVLAKLLAIYPSDFNSNICRDVFSGVKLSLFFGDINDELPKLDILIDCWFLDGFKPSSNPDMWSDLVFNNMARLSHGGTSFATFTSAGVVRRGLEARGFDVQKIRGFAKKREMLLGEFIAG